MITELKFIYNIIETLKENEYNNDERMEEEFLRDLLNTYRVDALRKYSSNGVSLSDEVFQNVDLFLFMNNTYEMIGQIPKIIRTTQDYGFYIEKDGVPIPIMTSEAYYLSKKGFTKSLPRAKTEKDSLTLFIGQLNNSCIEEGSENHLMIQSFQNDLSTLAEEQGFDKPAVKVNLKAALFDPTDASNYDWENDIYPFPAERIQELKMQLLYHEYGQVFKKLKKDEIQNAREDHVRYHDNTDIQQNKSAN